jgi:hypothetical protein
MGLTFALLVIGWVFFRAETIPQAFEYLGEMASKGMLFNGINYFTVSKYTFVTAVVSIIILVVTEWIHRERKHGFDMKTTNRKVNNCFFILLSVIIYLCGGNSDTFIYFQF